MSWGMFWFGFFTALWLVILLWAARDWLASRTVGRLHTLADTWERDEG